MRAIGLFFCSGGSWLIRFWLAHAVLVSCRSAAEILEPARPFALRLLYREPKTRRKPLASVFTRR